MVYGLGVAVAGVKGVSVGVGVWVGVTVIAGGWYLKTALVWTLKSLVATWIKISVDRIGEPSGHSAGILIDIL